MTTEISIFICNGSTHRPCPMEGTKWWNADEWKSAYEAHQGMWPDLTPWSKEEWDQLYAQGYRFCSVLKNGRAVATAGLWPHTNAEWEVIDVGTAPAFRRQGYGKAIVSFVTETILKSGHAATIRPRTDNSIMHALVAALGYKAK